MHFCIQHPLVIYHLIRNVSRNSGSKFKQLRTFRVELEKETLGVSGHSSVRGADEGYIHDSRKELLTVLDFCN